MTGMAKGAGGAKENPESLWETGLKIFSGE